MCLPLRVRPRVCPVLVLRFWECSSSLLSIRTGLQYDQGQKSRRARGLLVLGLLWADTSRARTARAPLLWQTRAGFLEQRFAEAIAEAVEWKHGQLLIRAIAAANAATAAAADTAWI